MMFHAQAAGLRERLEERLRRSRAENIYPVADWQIAERRFTPEPLGPAKSELNPARRACRSASSCRSQW